MRTSVLIVVIVVCGVLACWLPRTYRPKAGELLLAGLKTENAAWVDEALARGESPHTRDTMGMTALMWAACNGDAPTVDRLLKAGADHSARCHYGMTALAWAANFGRVDVMELLLDAGADVDQPTLDEGTALHEAAAMSQLEAASTLVARGADVNARSARGDTPLFMAAARGSDSLPFHGGLIARGAEPELRDFSGQSAIDAANGSPDLADVLRDASAARRGSQFTAQQPFRVNPE